MAPRTPVTIASRRFLALPVDAGKRAGASEIYPFASLVAPIPVFEIDTDKDAKGKVKTDKDGNTIYLKNEDGSWKLAIGENGLPIPVMNGDKQATDYDSFGVIGRTLKQVKANITAIEEKYLGTPATLGKDAKGKDIPNKTREFVAVETDAASDPDKATVRVFRTK